MDGYHNQVVYRWGLLRDITDQANVKRSGRHVVNNLVY